MEALYIKLYEKYSKLKVAKDHQLDEANQEQEAKFVEFVSAAEKFINHLTDENKKLSDSIDELRNDIISLRTAKDQQFDDFQQLLMEEKKKNRELTAEFEQLRQLQQERPLSSNRTHQLEEQNVNSTQHKPSSSRAQYNDSPMRITRKRARLSMETDSALHSPAVDPLELLIGNGATSAQARDAPTAHSEPGCCRSNIDNEGSCRCLFQNLVECLTSMKVSIAHDPKGRCIHAVHQSSGYSFNLTWVNKAATGGELLYHVSSLGTFANAAPEWMGEVIIFSERMCPIFFKRVSHVIKRP